jgi:hypothetical protein
MVLAGTVGVDVVQVRHRAETGGTYHDCIVQSVEDGLDGLVTHNRVYQITDIDGTEIVPPITIVQTKSP